MKNNLMDVNPAYQLWKSSMGPAKVCAFDALIVKLERYAKAICWQRLPDHVGEFDSIVGDAVWHATKYIEGFAGKSRFSTWFYQIVTNECNKFLGRRKDLREVELFDNLPARNILDARLDVISLLDQLEGPDHQLLRMVAEGLDFKTIGKSFGVSQNAATVRWNRLKERLKNAKG